MTFQLANKKLNSKNKLLGVRRYMLCEKGFTLAELMIVIAIIGIFSSLTVVNFRGNEKVREMDNQARLLLDGVKRMQTSALSGKIISDQVPIAYILEINKCLTPTNGVPCDYYLKAKTTNGELPIDEIKLDQSLVDIAGNNLRIEITPPRSDIKISLDGNITDEVAINLKHKDKSTITKIVRINSISGRIDILNN